MREVVTTVGTLYGTHWQHQRHPPFHRVPEGTEVKVLKTGTHCGIEIWLVRAGRWYITAQAERFRRG